MSAVKDRREKVLVNTGLSSTVSGCLVELERDSSGMVARIVVRGREPTDETRRMAVKQTAILLVERAKRFLGRGWSIESWDGVYG